MRKGLLMLMGVGLCLALAARNGNAGARDACKSAVAGFTSGNCDVNTCPKKLQDKFGPATFELNEPGKRMIGTIVYEKGVKDGNTRVVDVLVSFTCDQDHGCVVGCKLD